MKTQRFVSLLMLVLLSTVLTAQNDISGTVLYHNKAEYPIEGVTVKMYNQNNTLLGTALSNNEGVFTFSNLPSGIYTFRGEAINMPVINLYMDQAVRILNYLNGQEEFDEMQELAADVDGSGLVDYEDFLYYVVNYFGYNASFPAGEWVFTELEVNTESKTGGGSGGSMGGTKIGDVETVFVPVGKEYHFEYMNTGFQEIVAKAGQILEIPVSINRLSSDAAGFSLIMEFNPLLTEVIGISHPLYEVNYSVEGNILRSSFLQPQLLPIQSNEDVLLHVRVRVIRESGADYLPFVLQPGSHVVNTQGAIENAIEFSYPKISSRKIQQALSVSPNPASESVTAQIVAGQSGAHRLLIIAANGAIVMDEVQMLKEGANTLFLNINHLNSGVYQLLIHNTAYNSSLMNARIVKY